jgi:hypothetical protein
MLSSPDLRPSLLSIIAALREADLLDGFVTTFLLDDRRLTHRMLRFLVPPLRAQHRQIPESLRGRVHSVMWRELVRAFANRLSPRFGHKIWWKNETEFDRRVARNFVGRSAVFCGVEHAALETFRAQKRSGGRTVLRQVMAHADEADALVREAANGKDKAMQGRAWIIPDLERTRQRKLEEYALADRILANSDFVRDSFLRCGVPAEKVVSIPTGCPSQQGVRSRSGAGQGPIRFLFVGGVGYRKGVDVLIEAWRGLDRRRAELVVAGTVIDPQIAAAAEACGMQLRGHLAADQLRQAFVDADVFVLPSRLEGLAHSLLEALSFGLPLIATAETGAGRFLVQDGNGWRVPCGDVQALRAAMENALDQRARLPAMGDASLRMATSWTRDNATAATVDFFRGLF